ncbi:hypothetical protein EDD37DRAFT_677723 [Exophiala viscosa]|uniref:Uncharacterized protein n=1 Tax=Exophiala viscosa TaxID=2486360 RepID=A0AAN6E714_9EURO|nr:hypothetical protein EDD36DRAFT_460279 [Exophiala viscosa]KAI1627775.1 hypothetical protein EDD37DRAFT_677723 [Exophiala viscosa]
MASRMMRYFHKATGPKPTESDDQAKQGRAAADGASEDTIYPKQTERDSFTSPEQPQSAMEFVVEIPGSYEAVIKQKNEASRQLTAHSEQLEELIHRNSLLEQEFDDVVNILRSDKKRLSEVIKGRDNKIQGLEYVIADLQRERQQYMHESNVDRLAIKQQLRMRTQQLDGSRSEIKLLKTSLEECKDRIFSMQPVQGMSDTQLQTSYTDLCNSIEYWVEEQFDEVEDVIRKVITAGRPVSGPHVVWDHISKATFHVVKLNPELNNALLVALMSRYLYSQFLSADRVYPGLPDNTEAYLRDINIGINNISPAKDMDSIQSWRVDLYRTLSSLESAKKYRENALRFASTTIQTSFKAVRSMDMDTRTGKSTCNHLVADTADLAGHIRQSMTMYDFGDDPYEITKAVNGVLKLENWKNFKIIDSRTGQALRSSAVPVADENGRVGKILFVVHPAFIRKPTKTAAAIILVKPTIAVKFDHAIPRGGKRPVDG